MHKAPEVEHLTQSENASELVCPEHSVEGRESQTVRPEKQGEITLILR
jgi:hypothetical protein